MAKQKGLEPLASLILAQEVEEPVSKIAENYVTNEVKTPKEAIEGAQDIIAENAQDKLPRCVPNHGRSHHAPSSNHP